MKNFVEKGETITVTAAADIASGAIVSIGDIAGVAAGKYATGETAVVNLNGVYEVPKVTADVIAQGVKLYVVAGQAGVTATGNVFLGYAHNSAAGVAGTINVLLAR